MAEGKRSRGEEASLEKRLESRPAGELAALLGRLAEEIPEVERRTKDFLARSDPGAAAKRACARLRETLNRKANFDWGAAARLSAELGEVLDLVEEAVLPQDGSAAFGLLRDFIVRDGEAMELADDSNGEIGVVFHRACELLVRAAAHVSGAEAREAWEELVAGNDYGCRDGLSEGAVTALPAAELERFIAGLRAEMRGGGERAFSTAVVLMEVARGKCDPDLYAEASYRDAPRERHPAVALQVAQQYLAAGRAREAMEHLPASAEACGGYAGGWHETRIALARALGDEAGERAARWEQFCFAPIPETLAALLAVEPEESRGARREAALAFVRAKARDLPGKLRLFLAAGEGAEAAQFAVAQQATLNGDHYYLLVPLAETAVYRALLDSILRRANSKPYPHGAAYWHRLEALARKIKGWETLKSHEEYVAAVRAKHERKRAFWREAEAHDPAAWARAREERRKLFEEMQEDAENEDWG